MTGKQRFRLANSRDIDALVRMVNRYYAFEGIAFDNREVHSGLVALLRDASLGRAWLIECDASLAGYVILTFGYDHEVGGRTGLITDLYLEPQFRKRGLGKEIMTFVESRARSFGLSAVELQASRDNKVAQRLYKTLGYMSFDRIPMVKRL